MIGAHHSDRNAMEITFKAMLALAVSPLAFGFQGLPASLTAAPTLGRVAVVFLFVGCVVSLAGIMWRDRDDGLIIQQAGLTGVAFGALFYCGALVMSGGGYSQVALAAGLYGGIGTGAIARFVQLQTYVDRRITEAAEDIIAADNAEEAADDQ